MHVISGDSTKSQPSVLLRRDRLITFFALLAMYGITFFCLIWRYHYSTDSYRQIYDMAPFWHLQLGRFLNCWITMLIQSAGLNTVINQRFFLSIWIVSLALSTFVLVEVFARVSGKPCSLEKRLLLAAGVSITFLNVFNLELILFPEMASFLAVAMIALAGSIYCFQLQGAQWKALSAALLFIAIGGYQSFLGIYVSFVLVAIFCRLLGDHDTRRAVMTSVLCCLIAVLVAFCDIFLVKYLISVGYIADAGRGSSFAPSVILDNIRGILAYQPRLFLSADGMLPGPWLLLFAIILVFFLVRIARNIPSRDRVVLALVVIVSYTFAFAAHVVEANQELTARSNIAFWSVLAALSCLVIVASDFPTREPLSQPKKPRLGAWAVFPIATMTLLLISALAIQDVAEDNYMSNVLDRETAVLIDQKLDEYEQETGQKVAHIAWTQDSNPTISYPEVRYHGSQLGVKILQVNYSYNFLIDYVSGRNLDNVDMPQEIFDRYFAGKNWDALDLDEQLVIVGDTAYLAVY